MRERQHTSPVNCKLKTQWTVELLQLPFEMNLSEALTSRALPSLLTPRVVIKIGLCESNQLQLLTIKKNLLGRPISIRHRYAGVVRVSHYNTDAIAVVHLTEWISWILVCVMASFIIRINFPYMFRPTPLCFIYRIFHIKK